MAGEGQMLRAAREDKKWSLAETEEMTKIRIRYIQALEAEDYGKLPGATYAKGYLRTYAKHLGLNPDEIIALYSASIVTEVVPVLEKPQIQTKTRHKWVRPVIMGSMGFLIILVIVFVSINQSGKKIPQSPYAASSLPSAPKTTSQTPPPTPSVIPPQSVPTVTQDGLTAMLAFTQDCWIEVRIDGQSSFQGLFHAGTSKEIKGSSKIELVRIGNAAGLSVTLNGKALPSFGKAGQVVRNVVLTQNTLSAL